MSDFVKWSTSSKNSQGKHEITVLSTTQAMRQTAINSIAKAVPEHYASGKRYAHILKTLGKPNAAAYLEAKLPTSKSLRSGDLGEIVASAYVKEQLDYPFSVNRLRWKDHRNMAMRGDDILAIRKNQKTKRLEFLKGEAKSRVALTTAALEDARAALLSYNSRPSPHALSFVADRLNDQGKVGIADDIEKVLYEKGIALADVNHLLFTFSENDPLSLLQKNVKAYFGRVAQVTVGLVVAAHQKFIKAVFDKVANGKHS